MCVWCVLNTITNLFCLDWFKKSVIRFLCFAIAICQKWLIFCQCRQNVRLIHLQKGLIPFQKSFLQHIQNDSQNWSGPLVPRKSLNADFLAISATIKNNFFAFSHFYFYEPKSSTKCIIFLKPKIDEKKDQFLLVPPSSALFMSFWGN